MQTDPVCGMQIDEQSAAARSVFKNKTYFFCARSCKVQFERSPEEFLNQTFKSVDAQPINELHSKHVKNIATKLDKLDLLVSGMSCASCVARIEKGLLKIQGVAEAKINFAAERATIEYDPAKVKPSSIARKINELGYETKTQKAILPILGMSCAACVNRVQGALVKVPGVLEATVNSQRKRRRSNIFLVW